MKNFKTKNGVNVVINFNDFENSCKLKRLIEKELLKVNIKGDSLKGLKENSSIKDLLNLEIDSSFINNIKNLFLAVDSSEEIHEQVFKCLEKSTYDHEKITKDTFNNEQAIKDYEEVFIEGIIEFMRPFTSSLISFLTNNLITIIQTKE